MRYLTQANGQTFSVIVEDEGQVTVGDRTFGVDLEAIDEQALFSLLIDHQSYEMVVDQQQGIYRVLLWGEMYEVAVESCQPRRAKAKKPRPPALGDGECIVRAPIPGLVVQIPVSAGQHVSAGEVLVVLESMKMENELLAPRQGIVKAIHAAVGDTPSLDALLVTLQ